jgi:hypothetical protein
MLRNTMLILAGLVVGITAGVPTATATANGAVLGQCLFNDECAGTLVCSGQYCRALCRADKDCDANERCLAPGTDHAACEAIPRPASPGMIYGRVEAAFGVPPTSCTVQIIGGATTTCNSRGEFALLGVAAGRYELRVRAPNQGVGTRTVIAQVNPGVAASLGAIHLPAQALGAVDPTIDPATAPVWPSPGGKGKGDDGGKSSAAPKD